MSPNDEHLITAHRSSLLLKQWSNWRQFPTDPAQRTTKCTRTWKALHTAPIVHMSFDSSSTLLATSGGDYTTKVWDIHAQYCTHNLKGVTGITRAVRFFPNIERKQELVLGGDDGKVRVYCLNESIQIQLLDGHFSAVTYLEYLGERFERLLSSSRDKVRERFFYILYTLQKSYKIFIIPNRS